jgi:hypothetical protein
MSAAAHWDVLRLFVIFNRVLKSCILGFPNGKMKQLGRETTNLVQAIGALQNGNCQQPGVEMFFPMDPVILNSVLHDEELQSSIT